MKDTMSVCFRKVGRNWLSVPSSAWDRISPKLRFARVPDNSVPRTRQRSAAKTSRRG